MHNRLSNRLLLLTEQGRQKVVAILCSGVGKLYLSDRGGCSHEVGQASELIANRARRNLPRPARDERNAMAGVPDIGLLATPVRIGAMRKARFVFRLPVRSIVARKDHERILGKLIFLDRMQDLA